MHVLVSLALFLSLIGHSSGATYCLCKDGLTDPVLQKTIDYACGEGADCHQILQNGACYQPNTVKAHCDYAANSYFQNKNQGPGTCDFSGTATPSPNPPTSVAPGCSYPTSASQGGTSTGMPGSTPGIGTGGTTTGGTTTGGTGTGIGTGTGTGTGTGAGGIYSPMGMAPNGADFGNPSGASSLGNYLSFTITLFFSSLLLVLWGC